MTREATKRSPLPLALILAGAAFGAYYVVRKRQGNPITFNPDKITDACARSLAKLEQRMTAIAS